MNIKKNIKSKLMLGYAYMKTKNKKRAVFKKDSKLEAGGDFEKCNVEGNSVIISLTNAIVNIRVLKAGLIQINTLRNKEPDKRKSPAICKYDWDNTGFELTDTDDFILITTKAITIRILKSPFRIVFEDSQGIINEDYEAMGIGFYKKGAGSYKVLHKNEDFYGFGEKTGALNKRYWETINWNTDEPRKHDDSTKSLYSSIPFFIGVNEKRAYGIFMDNPSKTCFNMGKEDSRYYFFGCENGNLNYYFIYGPGISDVVESYTELTGRIKLPPIWALGYHQSRWSYYPEKKVVDICKAFRKRDIPCDAIYLDIDYMDGYRVFTWDYSRFPDPKKMLENIHQMGFRLVTIIDPGVKVDEEYDVYREGKEKEYFLKTSDQDVFIGRVWPMDSAFPDFLRKDVREWWGSLDKGLIDMGVDGIWNDMNEPSVFNTTYKTLPENVYHEGDLGNVFHEEVHNLYGMMMDAATYEGIKDDVNNRRPFILTRSGYSGVQRYAALWTGDNMSLWEHLRLSIPMNCNLGLSGISFTGTDVGGFAGDCPDELLVRWTQLGAFMPFFRNHSAITSNEQEPWEFGKKTEDICRDYIKLRYKLMPYIYNLFYSSSVTGAPIVRPVVYEYQEDDKAKNIEDEFFLGGSILVSPVVNEDVKLKSVYLPEGKWIDYWDHSVHEGNNYVSIEAPLEKLPLFIKDGSIIPEWEPQNYIGEKEIETLKLNIYSENNCSYTYYEDDGLTPNYENGEYNLTEFSFERNNVSLLRVIKKYNGFKGTVKNIEVNIFNFNEPKEINCKYDNDNEEKIKFEFNGGTLQFIIPLKNELVVEIL